jgi:hypothetical protein
MTVVQSRTRFWLASGHLCVFGAALQAGDRDPQFVIGRFTGERSWSGFSGQAVLLRRGFDPLEERLVDQAEDRRFVRRRGSVRYSVTVERARSTA